MAGLGREVSSSTDIPRLRKNKMPISFSTNKEIARGVAYLGIPTGVDGDGKINVGVVLKADKDSLGDAFFFAGFLKRLAQSLGGDGPMVIYNAEDFDEYGCDLPTGFEFPDEP